MRLETLEIDGLLVVEPPLFADDRGYFFETFSEPVARRAGMGPRFVQDNQSHSVARVLRGLHAQLTRPQGKLVRVVTGAVFDVAVDLRLDSPTFGNWVGIELSADNRLQLWIPPGFVHGFCALSDTADVLYKCTELYDPGDEVGLRWNDPDIGIDWPGRPTGPVGQGRRSALPGRAATAARERTGLPPGGEPALDMTLRELSRYEAELTAAGIGLDEAERQIELLHTPPPPARLDRCCTVGDGIRVLGTAERHSLDATWHDAAARGRFSKFVPASGAASRMFSQLDELRSARAPSREDLRSRARGGDDSAATVDELLSRLEELPFFAELATSNVLVGRDPRQLASGDGYPALLDAILDPAGLGYARRAKALIPFHRYGDATRSALDEHLAEAADYVRGTAPRSRVHFTVTHSSLPDFERAVAESPFAAGFDVSFSTQHESTSTLALEPDGSPAHTADGRLLLRPGGHGALLENLQSQGGDLVYLKNIDNVLPESQRREVVVWQRLLGGLLVELEAGARRTRQALLDGRAGATEAAAEFCRRELGHPSPPTDREELWTTLLGLLERPLRVCGMVRNAGEPGGGPFWVEDASGVAYPQIVESAQVDLTDAAQSEVWRSSTHFNPVMLVAALRRHDGGAYELADFVDRQAVFVSRKPFEGRTLTVLEHPGLWNGAMARWNTVFVEVPLATFAPVKTVLDLLRPEHLGA